MNVSTIGYPPLYYMNESITIECTATDYTDVTTLRIRDKVKIGLHHGCEYNGGAHSPNNVLLQPAFPDLTKENCESSLRRTTPPSTLSVTGSVTDDLIGLQLYCYASNIDDRAENGDLTIDTIRGTLLKLTNVILQFIYFSKFKEHC